MFGKVGQLHSWRLWGEGVQRCRKNILSLVTVFQAGKFDVIPTMINIGSGLALFGVVSDTAVGLNFGLRAEF